MSTAYNEMNEASIFDEVDDAFLKIKELVQCREWLSKPHDEIEDILEREGRELMRRFYQAFVKQAGQQSVVEETSVVGDDGVRRGHHRLRGRIIASIFGKVELPRVGYGARGAPSLFPVDAALNLPQESHSLAVRRRAAELVAQNSFDEATQSLRKSTGASVAKRQMLELTSRASQDFDAFYQQRVSPLTPEQSSDILVLSIDMKGISMRHEDLRQKTREAAKKTKPKLDKRRSVGERRNRKRMAVVAVVHTIEPHMRTALDVVAGLRGQVDQDRSLAPRPRPEDKRIWASISHEPEAIVRQAFEEALARDPERSKHWVILVDGDRNQLCWIKRQAKRYGVRPTIIVDIIHVIEYLWKAAHAFHGPYTKEAEEWVAERLLKVLEGKAGWVAGGMRRSAKMRDLSADERKRVYKCANYLKNYSPYLRYDKALEAGLPIATGIVEGACRYLIGDRLEITGARWSLNGAEAILRLRALRASGDFDAYWDFHKQQEYQRNHGALYASGEHPQLQQPTRRKGHLRLVG